MYLSVLQVDIIIFFSDHGTYAYNVGKTIINHPPVITIFIGGMVIVPNHGWFMALFYQHYG